MLSTKSRVHDMVRHTLFLASYLGKIFRRYFASSTILSIENKSDIREFKNLFWRHGTSLSLFHQLEFSAHLLDPSSQNRIMLGDNRFPSCKYL